MTGIVGSRPLRAGSWSRVEQRLLLLYIIACGPWSASAQLLAPGVDRVRRSSSGQFIVNAAVSSREWTRGVSNLETNQDYLRLDPTLVPVSCERIKQVVTRYLGLGAPWTGRIFLSFFPARSADDPVTITSGHFRDGWQYRVEVPDVVHRLRYVRAIVQVLLLETANRTASEHSAEIPVWLTEGLAQHVMLSSEIEVILPPPRPGAGSGIATRAVSARKENPLETIHRQLCASPLITFQQLSWPEPGQFEGETGATYRHSACFFIHELMRLDNGAACLRVMLARLPRHYNWQFAFLEAFRDHFHRPLDVEKWWTLHLEHFTSRELAQTWPPEQSWQKLDELIRSAVQVRAGTNEMPMRAEVKLQTVVREWDRVQQDQVLRAKLSELLMLRLRLAPEYVPLADEYHRVLSDYLHARDHAGFLFRKQAARQRATEEAARRLEELDSRRLELKPAGAVPVQARSRPR